jgi:aminopeptidase N
LRSLSDSTPNGHVRRIADEAMRRVQKAIGKDSGLKQLGEELDQVCTDNQELTPFPLKK